MTAVLLGGLTFIMTAAGPPAKEEMVRQELARLAGTWQLVSAETDGRKAPDDLVRTIQVRIRGDRHSVIIGGKEQVKDIPFVIDPTATPKTTEDHLPDGRVIRGIYELTGDTLRSCVAAPGAPRPTEFTAKAGMGQTLRVFRRVKE